MTTEAAGTEPDLMGQFSIDEEKEPDRIKKAVLQGLIEKNVNLSDFELGELLGFKSSSIEKVRKDVAKSKMDSKGNKCHSWDYVLAFDVGDDELIMPSKDALEAAKERGEEHEEWENGMKRSKYYGQIINEIWSRLEKARLKVDCFRSHKWPTESAGDAGSEDGGVDRSDVTLFLLVGITENDLKVVADYRDTDLLINPLGAVELGRQRGFPLAERTRMENDPSPPTDGRKDPFPLPLSNWQNLYGEYNQAANPRVYRDYERLKGGDSSLRTVFDEKTRLRIIYECIIADTNDGGAEVKIENWILDKKNPLKAVFALHDPAMQDHFEETWIKNWKIGDLMKAPLGEIRAYFGEPVAFYFGFLMFYLRWLVAPAALGLIFFIWQMATLAQGEYTIAVDGIFFMGLFMIFWCVAFVDFWARQEATYRQQWGMSKFEEKAVARPQFEGEWVADDISGEDIEDYPTLWRSAKQSAVYAVVTVWMSLCVFLVIYVLAQRDREPNNFELKVGLGIANSVMIIVFDAIYKKISMYGNDWENHRTDQDYENHLIAKSFVFRFVNSFASLFYLAFLRPQISGYAFYIRFNNNVCPDAPEFMSTMYQAYLNGTTNGDITDTFDFETYAEGTTYDSNQFENCAEDYTECQNGFKLTDDPKDYTDQWNTAYQGFYLISNVSDASTAAGICGDWTSASGLEAETDGTWYCEPACGESTMLNERNQAILLELQIQLITLFLTAIVIQNTLEVGVPFLKEWIAAKREGDDAETEKSEAEIQMEKERYSNTIDDMSEMVVQFGYVTLFVMCFPLIPLLAIINNIFELKVDATNLVMSSQRPDPNGSDGLGTWNSVLGLFSILSVATNALLITTRTNLLSQVIADDGEVVKLWFFCGFSIILSVIVAIEKWVIPDVPASVTNAEERQRLVENVLIKGTVLDDEDENKKGNKDDDDEDWPFNPHLEELEVIESTKKVPIMVSQADPDNIDQ